MLSLPKRADYMQSNPTPQNCSKYLLEKKVGQGAYGTVYKAKNTQTGEIVALKKLAITNPSEGVSPLTLREIALIKELKHPNIINLKDVVDENGNYELIFEWIDQDLENYLNKLDDKQYLPPDTVKYFMFQLLSGVAHMHKRKIMHRDLKPQNILIDNNSNLKIADFGLARRFSIPPRPYTHEVVTLHYRAPEILLNSIEYSAPIDIWSVGCIFVEMMTKRVLFKGDSELDQLIKIMRTRGTPNAETWNGLSFLKGYQTIQHYPNFSTIPWKTILGGYNLDSAGYDLLEKMLKYDPCERITAKQALNHPYFHELTKKGKFGAPPCYH